jgi:hypothetical protein
MPKLGVDSMETGTIGGSHFQFSGTRIDHLGATEYTLVTIAADFTGSVEDFLDALVKCVKATVGSCKKSPRSNNLLVRVIYFSSSFSGGIDEIHGFKPLGEINLDDYPTPRPSGSTPLFDASFSSVGATNTYAQKLMDQDFLVNGIFFVITDGDDNASSATIRMIKQEMDRGSKSEIIESLIGILIGINANGENYKGEKIKDFLDTFAAGVGLKFLDAGDATPGKLAKLAEFVSQSVSSQSQALGTGGPSQNIAATI